jgi:hypothetical protein
LARQTSSCTGTSVLTFTEISMSVNTITTTITQAEPKFSCPTLAVTNTVGAVLSLDGSCSLAYSPATTNSTKNSAGISIHGGSVFAWQIAIVISFGLLIL